jgi:hypothetical protein
MCSSKEEREEREERMQTTLVELEFVELPYFPKADGTMDNGYLLSMWNCACQLATWNASAERFEDEGGRLNPLAIRSWAVLPKPIDYGCWGGPIVRAALANDKSRQDAGWLEPKYDPV